MHIELLEDGRHLCEISHSSKSNWLTCRMLGYLQYKNKLVIPKALSNFESTALTQVYPPAAFGSALHEAIPYWSLTGDLEGAFNVFKDKYTVPLEEQSSNYYKESRGLAILTTYQGRYADSTGRDKQPIAHLRGADGTRIPLVEKTAKFIIYEDEKMVILYVAKLDRIVLDEKESNGVWVVDTKTTGSSIDPDGKWYQAQLRSDQYTGYTLTAAELYEDVLNVPVLGTIVDCIYTRRVVVAPSDMARYKIRRKKKAETALRESVAQVVREIIPVWNEEVIPTSNAPAACSMYSGCRYLPTCHTDPVIALENTKNIFCEPEEEKSNG